MLRPFLSFALRDALFIGATIAVAVMDARLRAADDAWSTAVGLVTGLLVVVVGFVAHEWGHLLGALVWGGAVEAPARLSSVFLFRFDTGRSSPGQFLSMSAGGYVASLIAMGVIVTWADLGAASGLSAVTLAGLGIATTFALEIPTTVRVLRGGPMPGAGGVYVRTEG